jgi:hypothetical protein
MSDLANLVIATGAALKDKVFNDMVEELEKGKKERDALARNQTVELFDHAGKLVTGLVAVGVLREENWVLDDANPDQDINRIKDLCFAERVKDLSESNLGGW